MKLELGKLADQLVSNINKATTTTLGRTLMTKKEYGVLVDNIEKSLNLLKGLDEFGSGEQAPQNNPQEKTLKEAREYLIGKTYDPREGSGIESSDFVVFFSTELCPACKEISPIYEQVFNELEIQVEHIDMSVKENIDYALELKIKHYPAIIIVKNQKIVHIDIRLSSGDKKKDRKEIKDQMLKYLS